jgi:membrane protein DedA with SNARE-associated domain
VLGRSFAANPFVVRLRTRPGFSHAYRLVRSHPNLFVLCNRYIYGMRLVGGIASGISGISPLRSVALNGISSAVWASLFVGIGYLFGLGAERVVGRALLHHQRLLAALAIGVAVAVAAFLIAHHVANRERRNEEG